MPVPEPDRTGHHGYQGVHKLDKHEGGLMQVFRERGYELAYPGFGIRAAEPGEGVRAAGSDFLALPDGYQEVVG